MKLDIYQQVTDRIIAQLEQGVVPWKSPYLATVGFPRNFATGKAYQGINVFLLGSLRFSSPLFLTFIQSKELGGNVRKGEKGHTVIMYGTYSKQEESNEGEADAAERRSYLKAYTVFNTSQIEGIDFPQQANLPELSLTEQTNRAREIVAGMPNPPTISEGSAIPRYRPGTEGLTLVCEAIKRSSELEEVRLYVAGIDDEGIRMLCDAVLACKTIKYMALYGNKYGFVGKHLLTNLVEIRPDMIIEEDRGIISASASKGMQR